MTKLAMAQPRLKDPNASSKPMGCSIHPGILGPDSKLLRQKSWPVALSGRRQAEESWEKLEQALNQARAKHDFRNCIGLSAIQIGIPLRVALVWSPNMGYLHIANPEIVEYSAQTAIEHENCLSFFDMRGRVARPIGVAMRYLGQDFSKTERSFSGWTARVIQHQLDHLDGILFTDRMLAGEPLMPYGDYASQKAAA